MEVSGKIKDILQEQQVSANFKKRELIVTTDEQYPQQILIEFHQDKCDLLNQYEIGWNVKVHINLRGREWVNPQGETKYFNSIQGWKIENMNQRSQQTAASTPAVPPAETFAPATNFNEEEHDDLPF
ncbi:DUF3127 domain-containing protein [Flavobacterium sp.]|uniref:DUF3127 domain-containing protein n=1 Tax=Flavobacterium sp. TaxID=239 RepID=UPI003D6B28C5